MFRDDPNPYFNRPTPDYGSAQNILDSASEAFATGVGSTLVRNALLSYADLQAKKNGAGYISEEEFNKDYSLGGELKWKPGMSVVHAELIRKWKIDELTRQQRLAYRGGRSFIGPFFGGAVGGMSHPIDLGLSVFMPSFGMQKTLATATKPTFSNLMRVAAAGAKGGAAQAAIETPIIEAGQRRIQGNWNETDSMMNLVMAPVGGAAFGGLLWSPALSRKFNDPTVKLTDSAVMDGAVKGRPNPNVKELAKTSPSFFQRAKNTALIKRIMRKEELAPEDANLITREIENRLDLPESPLMQKAKGRLDEKTFKQLYAESVPVSENQTALAGVLQEIFGVETRFHPELTASGRISVDNPTVLFIKAGQGISQTFEAVGHELTHSIRIRDPRTYRRLVNTLADNDFSIRTKEGKQRLLLEQARDEVKARYGDRWDSLSEPRKLDEMVAQSVGIAAKHPEFWRRLYKRDRNAFQKAVDFFVQIFQRIQASLKGSDLDQWKELFGDIADAISKADKTLKLRHSYWDNPNSTASIFRPIVNRLKKEPLVRKRMDEFFYKLDDELQWADHQYTIEYRNGSGQWEEVRRVPYKGTISNPWAWVRKSMGPVENRTGLTEMEITERFQESQLSGEPVDLTTGRSKAPRGYDRDHPVLYYKGKPIDMNKTSVPVDEIVFYRHKGGDFRYIERKEGRQKGDFEDASRSLEDKVEAFENMYEATPELFEAAKEELEIINVEGYYTEHMTGDEIVEDLGERWFSDWVERWQEETAETRYAKSPGFWERFKEYKKEVRKIALDMEDVLRVMPDDDPRRAFFPETIADLRKLDNDQILDLYIYYKTGVEPGRVLEGPFLDARAPEAGSIEDPLAFGPRDPLDRMREGEAVSFGDEDPFSDDLLEQFLDLPEEQYRESKIKKYLDYDLSRVKKDEAHLNTIVERIKKEASEYSEDSISQSLQNEISKLKLDKILPEKGESASPAPEVSKSLKALAEDIRIGDDFHERQKASLFADGTIQANIRSYEGFKESITKLDGWLASTDDGPDLFRDLKRLELLHQDPLEFEAAVLKHLDREHSANTLGKILTYKKKESFTHSIKEAGDKAAEQVATFFDGLYRKDGFKGLAFPWLKNAQKNKDLSPVFGVLFKHPGLYDDFMNDRITKELTEHLLSGLKTETRPDIAELAQVIQATQKAQVARFNKHGAKIQWTEGYAFSQSYELTKRYKGPDAQWIKDFLEAVDWEKTRLAHGNLGNFDPATETFANFDPVGYAKQFLEFQKTQAWRPKLPKKEKLGLKPSDGLAQVDGNVASQVSHHRLVFFKPEKFWDWNQKYGSGSASHSIIRGLERKADQSVLVSTFGPRYDEVIGNIRQALPNNEGYEWLLDRTIRQSTGELDHPADPHLADWGRTARNASNVINMWSSGITALTDLPTITSALQYQGTSVGLFGSRVNGAYWRALKRNKTGKSHFFFRGVGAGADALTGAIARRLTGDAAGFGGLEYWNQKVFHWNQLELLTTAGQEATIDILTRAIPEGDVDMARLTRYGISEEDAKILVDMAQEVEGLEGRRIAPYMLDEKHPQLADKLRSYFDDVMRQAVLEPDPSTQAITRMGFKDGTVAGVAARVATQYAAFPLSMLRKTWGRFYNGYGDENFLKLIMNPNNRLRVHMLTFFATSLAMGYVVTNIKDMLKGREPLFIHNMNTENFMRIIEQSGIAGPLASLMEGIDGDGQDIEWTENLSPMANTVEDLVTGSFAKVAMNNFPGASAPVFGEATKNLLAYMFGDAIIGLEQYNMNRLNMIEQKFEQSSIPLELLEDDY